MKFQGRVLAFLVLFFLATNQAAYSFVVINEILADPPSGLAGDANGDGVTSSNQDEFVELFNSANNSVDVSGWYLMDTVQKRHVFSNNLFLLPHEVVVVFGGGLVNLSGIHGMTASTGLLSLNNTGDKVSLFNQNNQLVDEVIYGAEAGHDHSIVRSPEGTGNNFISHLDLANAAGKKFSAGYFVNPLPKSTAAVPEPGSLYCLGVGLSTLIWRRKKIHRGTQSPKKP